MAVLLLVAIVFAATCSVQAAAATSPTHRLDPPPVPAWPSKFTAEFTVRVEQFGPEWSAKGVVYYDWETKVFRADYIDWCLPLFDTGNPENSNFTCTYLARDSMYFVNGTSEDWKSRFCCLFEKGLAVVPPDWMKNEQYNGTASLRGKYCDVWWFPGTNNPQEPCYGYWNIRDEQNTPWQFFGLSSVGPTILEYDTFTPGIIPPGIELDIPNEQCTKECQPPSRLALQQKRRRRAGSTMAAGAGHKRSQPHFPSCE